MKKTSEKVSPVVGFVICITLMLILGVVLFQTTTGKMTFVSSEAKGLTTIVMMVAMAIVAVIATNTWKRWHGATLTEERPAPVATAPVAPATTAPATTAPVAPTAKKITRAYLQQQAALVDDRMVEAEEVYEAAEQLQDEYMADKSDYEQKLAKAMAHRLPPQQP